MAEIVLLTEDHKFYKDIKQYPKVFRWFTTQKVAIFSNGNRHNCVDKKRPGHNPAKACRKRDN